MTEDAPLTGRKALVIGAGTPAGRTIAVALAEAGADVAVAASSLDGEEVMACRRTRRAIEQLGRRSAEYAFDVTLGQNVQVSTRQVAKEMGGLNILVYAVWAALERPAEKITDAEWSRLLAGSLSGAFYACRAGLREMLTAGGGRIVLAVPAPVAARGHPSSATQAAHGGMVGLVQGIAAEFEGRRIDSYGIVLYEAGVAPARDHRHAEDHFPHDIGALAVFLVSTNVREHSGGVYPAVLPA